MENILIEKKDCEKCKETYYISGFINKQKQNCKWCLKCRNISVNKRKKLSEKKALDVKDKISSASKKKFCNRCKKTKSEIDFINKRGKICVDCNSCRELKNNKRLNKNVKDDEQVCTGCCLPKLKTSFTNRKGVFLTCEECREDAKERKAKKKIKEKEEEGPKVKISPHNRYSVNRTWDN